MSPAKPPDAAQCDLRADTVQREDGAIRALVWDTATRPDGTFSLTWWRDTDGFSEIACEEAKTFFDTCFPLSTTNRE